MKHVHQIRYNTGQSETMIIDKQIIWCENMEFFGFFIEVNKNLNHNMYLIERYKSILTHSSRLLEYNKHNLVV